MSFKGARRHCHRCHPPPGPWNKVEGTRMKPRSYTVREEVWGVQDRSKRKGRRKGKAGGKKKSLKGKNTSEICGRLTEEIGIKSHLRGPMEYAKTLKLRFRVRDLDRPETRKRGIPVVGRGEEKGAQVCPCGKAKENRCHIVGEREMY